MVNIGTEIPHLQERTGPCYNRFILSGWGHLSLAVLFKARLLFKIQDATPCLHAKVRPIRRIAWPEST